MNGAPFNGMPLRSTALAYVRELLGSAQDPYTPVSRWIQRHVVEGNTVCVLPQWRVFPLMYHAPKPVYAWQFDGPAPEIGPLNRIHYWGWSEPDYVIGFGPYGADVPRWLRSADGSFPFSLVARIDVYWEDLYRPEFFWRSFTPITKFDRELEAVFIYEYTPRLRRRPAPSLVE